MPPSRHTLPWPIPSVDSQYRGDRGCLHGGQGSLCACAGTPAATFFEKIILFFDDLLPRLSPLSITLAPVTLAPITLALLALAHHSCPYYSYPYHLPILLLSLLLLPRSCYSYRNYCCPYYKDFPRWLWWVFLPKNNFDNEHRYFSVGATSFPVAGCQWNQTIPALRIFFHCLPGLAISHVSNGVFGWRKVLRDGMFSIGFPKKKYIRLLLLWNIRNHMKNCCLHSICLFLGNYLTLLVLVLKPWYSYLVISLSFVSRGSQRSEVADIRESMECIYLYPKKMENL